MSELSTPASWAEVTVGEILDVQYGKALATKVRQAGDVGVWTSGGETGSHNASLAEGPALVIGRKGAAGRVHLVDGPFWATDTAYYALVPEGYSPAFLYWCLTASRLDRLDQSTALPSLSRDHLRAVKIAVPPLHEQRAIVAAIENAFARIDAIGVELDSVAALTANFRRSSERDAFATASGTTITLGELCAQQGGAIQTGPFGSQLHAHDYRDEGTPVLMPRDLDPEGINWDRCARIGDDDVNRLTRHILEPGDIVQSRRGDLTRRAVVAAGSERALCGTGCFVIRLKDEGLAPFVAAALSEPTVAYAIEQASAGVTMPNLNGKTLASVRIPLPDERSRGALLVAVSQSREASQLIDAGVAETRADLVRLRASVLHRAFTGDLLGTSVSEIAGAAA